MALKSNKANLPWSNQNKDTIRKDALDALDF